VAKLRVTTKQEATVELSPRLLAQVRTKMVRYRDLSAEINERKTEQKDIKTFVEDAFIENGEGDALLNGADVNGIPVKMVIGKRKVFNRKKFIARGGNIALYDECMEEHDNNPYIRIGAEKE
jgi:hypothetical protein